MRSTKIGPSPSDGSSSSSIRGRDIRARAIASCCCSPPDSVPASWPDRSPRIGNRSSQRCASARSSSRSDPGDAADRQVLLDRELREHVASLGDQRDPTANDRLGTHPDDRRAVEPDRAGTGLERARERAEQGGLPRPVRAERRDDLPGGDLQGDVAEREHAAVPDGQPVDGEQRICHRAIGHPAGGATKLGKGCTPRQVKVVPCIWINDAGLFARRVVGSITTWPEMPV